MEHDLLLRVTGVCVITLWGLFLVGKRRWAKLGAGPTLALVPVHRSWLRFLQDASLVPATAFIVPLGAFFIGGVPPSLRLFYLLLLLPVGWGLVLTLGNLHAFGTSIRTHDLFDQLARLEGVEMTEVGESIALPKIFSSAPLRSRLGWPDRSWMALTICQGSFGRGFRQVAVWSDVQRDLREENPSETRVWRRVGASDAAMNEAFRRTQDDAAQGGLDAVAFITLLGDQLTLVANPPDDLRAARQLLWAGRTYKAHLRDVMAASPGSTAAKDTGSTPISPR
ncbi:MAG: hypothetical protein QM778_34175 [Myxococcales bacterium]